MGFVWVVLSRTKMHESGNRALLPLTDWPIFVPFMRLREQKHRETLRRLADPIRQVLQELEAGPLTSRRVTTTEKVSGYWDPEEVRRTKATTLALQLLWEIGVPRRPAMLLRKS